MATKQSIAALNQARNALWQVAEKEGDLGWNQDYWKAGGEGYAALQAITAALAAEERNTEMGQRSTPQVLVLLQVSLGQAYLALEELAARTPAVEQELSTLLAESQRLAEAQAANAKDRPGFQAHLATLCGVVAVLMDRAEAEKAE